MLLPGRKRTPSVLDLVPWADLAAEGVVAHVDGALSSTFLYRGPDLATAGGTEVTGLHRTFHRALELLHGRWALHVTHHRLPAPPYPVSQDPAHPFPAAFDRERRQRYETGTPLFVGRTYLTFTYQPHDPAARGLWTVFRPPRPAAVQEAEIERFLETTGQAADLLATAVPEVRRLSSPETVELLYSSLTGRHHPLLLSGPWVSLEAVLGAGDLHLGRTVRFEETTFLPIALVAFPAAVDRTALTFLDELPFPCHLVTRFLPLEAFEARRAVARVSSRWAAAAISARELATYFFTRDKAAADRARDRYADSLAEEAREALDGARKDGQKLGYLTATVLVFDPSPETARERAGQVLRQLRNRGFAAHVETVNAAHAFLGSLPGCAGYNPRRPLFLAEAALSLSPLTSVWVGSPTHPHRALACRPAHLVTQGGPTPFFLNLCPTGSDVQHSLLVGPTGAGKSVLVNALLAAYLRYSKVQVFAIDRGLSLYATTLAAGGRHYHVNHTRGLRFAPVADLGTPRERQQALEWVVDLLRLQGYPLTTGTRTTLQQALENLATSDHRSLSNLSLRVGDPEVQRALAPYTGDGAYAHLFDGAANVLGAPEEPLHVFELEAVLGLDRAVAAPLLAHLFTQIERRLDGTPTLVLVEEVLSYVADSTWAERLGLWLRELRKRHAGVVLVAQNLQGLLDSSLGPVLLEGCSTQVFLPDRQALSPERERAYRAFGLRPRQVELLSRLQPKAQYLLESPDGCRVFSLDLSPAALSLFGLAGPEAPRRLEPYLAQHGPRWLEAFLEDGGHHDFAALCATLAGAAEEDR